MVIIPVLPRLALRHGCTMNVDSVFNAVALVRIADQMQRPSEVLIRLNIDIQTNVHPYLKTGESRSSLTVTILSFENAFAIPASDHCKFGVVLDDLDAVLERLLASPWIKIIGFHCHLGSTINDMDVYRQVFEVLNTLAKTRRHQLPHIRILNIGGGLGINYHKQNPKVGINLV